MTASAGKQRAQGNALGGSGDAEIAQALLGYERRDQRNAVAVGIRLDYGHDAGRAKAVPEQGNVMTPAPPRLFRPTIGLKKRGSRANQSGSFGGPRGQARPRKSADDTGSPLRR